MDGEVKNKATGAVLTGFFIYGCSACGKGFPMFTEKGIEEDGDGDDHKPAPFMIECPFCKSVGNCHDVSFAKLPVRQASALDPENRRVPYFANVEGYPCGKPTDMEFAVPVYRKVEKAEPGDTSDGNSVQA